MEADLAGLEERTAAGDNNSRESAAPDQHNWLTVDGPLGVHDLETARSQARKFFYGGFALLPWLWFINCFYFWPVLRRHNNSTDPVLRSYILRSAIGFSVCTFILLIWGFTFAIGGNTIFGSSWESLVLYKIADNYDLSMNY